MTIGTHAFQRQITLSSYDYPLVNVFPRQDESFQQRGQFGPRPGAPGPIGPMSRPFGPRSLGPPPPRPFGPPGGPFGHWADPMAQGFARPPMRPVLDRSWSTNSARPPFGR